MEGSKVTGAFEPLSIEDAVSQRTWHAADVAELSGRSRSQLESTDPVELALELQMLGARPSSNLRQLFAHGWIDGALESHPRISRVIGACAVFGIPVRWFDFKQFEAGRVAKGGDAEFLTPVNAVEVRVRLRPVTPKAMFYALSLSRANRESLAYIRHEEDREPAVLFTGDSRLTTWGKAFPRPQGMPLRRNILVTAMHHASSHNEPGYAVLQTWLCRSPALLVRNGGHRVRSVASGFLSVRDRLCVRCAGSSLRDLAVRVEAFRGRWRMPNHPRPCLCT